MVEAANTTASAAGIWVIVVVAVVALAGWLTAIMLADRSQVRASGPQAYGESRLTGSGGWAGGSVAGAQAPEIPGEAVHEAARAPAQPTEAGQYGMPRQRTGEADRAGRSRTGPGARDDEEPGR